MEVFNIKKFSLHDGPGIRTTFFLRGCPLNCIWCHNPESFRKLVGSKSCDTSESKNYGIDKIVEIAKQDLPFYEESGGGITFSGGEPLLQHKELIEALKRLKDEDIHTAIDTSGYADPDLFRNVVTNADLVLFDLKLYASKKHKEYTGVSNHKIIENFYQLSDNSVATYVRIPLIPKITDTEENLFALKELLLQNRSIRRLDLLPYNELADSKYKRLDINHEIAGLKTQNEIQLNQIKSIFEDVPFEITLRG